MAGGAHARGQPGFGWRSSVFSSCCFLFFLSFFRSLIEFCLPLLTSVCPLFSFFFHLLNSQQHVICHLSSLVCFEMAFLLVFCYSPMAWFSLISQMSRFLCFPWTLFLECLIFFNFFFFSPYLLSFFVCFIFSICIFLLCIVPFFLSLSSQHSYNPISLIFLL